eukprot:TRINITY_DN58178_c0_g1_i1.p1 TRINITY_DN58178_c0_g1~~TRINITY_DN58178_c0_g1_i1.p1  ORF type:complete len:496 (-),score=78.15 TRINITY_DN58178_c0_g1_i1:159-1646(-)
MVLSLLALLVASAVARSWAAATPCPRHEALDADVSNLRKSLPDFVVKLGQPYQARQILAGQKLRLAANQSCEGWPWKLKVDLRVKKGPYRKEHRVILEIPAEYPKQPLTVRIGSKLSNTYFHEVEDAHSSLPSPVFQRLLSRDGGTLGGALTLLHSALLGPVSDTLLQSQWDSRAREFAEETSVVKKYRKKRVHKKLFSVNGFDEDKFIDKELLGAIAKIGSYQNVDEARAFLLSTGLVQEVVPEMVYSFPVFTDVLLKLVMEEINGFYKTKLPARRPNSMNNYGIILNEIGLEPLMFALQDAVIQPLAAVLFPREGSELESHHAFTIRYKDGEDKHLDVHTDDSDVTFNVNIFGDYEGCPLVFCGIVGAPDHRKFKVAYQHRLGHAVMHSGRHRHGAEDITGGERMNLVIWSYSYNFRQSAASKKKHKRELGPPDMRCLSYTHDRDFGHFREYPPGKRDQFFGRGWCPQKGKEYAGFVPEAPSVARHSGARADL